MPNYTIRDPQTGRTLTVRGDSPPTEQELEELFASQRPTASGSARVPVSRGLAPSTVNGLVDALPAAGGMMGGLVGGTAGLAGAGVGTVPGAIGGAMMGGMAGQTAKNVINSMRGRPAPQGVLEAFGSVGTSGLEQGAMQAVGPAIGAIGNRVALALMQSALKPGLKTTMAAVKRGNTPPVIQTLLDEGVNVTRGGVAKLQGIVDASNTAIKDALAPLTSKTIEPLRVASRLNSTARTFANQVAPEADLASISNVGQQFLRARGAQNLSPVAAQELKQGTYKVLSGRAYGEAKTAAVEAEKALARGLKEEIAAEAQRSGVDISAINLREGKAINALEAVARRVAVAGNRDTMGLAGLAVSHPATFLTVLMDRSGAVKSMLARGLYQSAGKATGVAPNLIRMAVSSLASQPDQQQE